MLKVPGTQVIAPCWPAGKRPTTTYLHVTDSHDWRASRYENQHDLTDTTLRETKFILHTGDMSPGGATSGRCRW